MNVQIEVSFKEALQICIALSARIEGMHGTQYLTDQYLKDIRSTVHAAHERITRAMIQEQLVTEIKNRATQRAVNPTFDHLEKK